MQRLGLWLSITCSWACSATDEGADGDAALDPRQPDAASADGTVQAPDARVPVAEICNLVDDDGDGSIDEGLPINACGGCGAIPAEVCNGADDDCDGSTDEGSLNACGTCGPLPGESCNGADDDCDGSTDEGLPLNACGECGPTPVESCDGEDNDCDDNTDEGLLNACGACGLVPVETCDGDDNDCDGATDEGLLNACGACGAAPAEVCNGLDDDCDGRSDEGVANACGDCGALPEETCNGVDDDCDHRTDEGVTNRCGECGAEPEEVCDFRDNDCDHQVDEGDLRNACGGCGALPTETCNGGDDDCDGSVDEDLLNACGRCGEVPIEVCNARDDDCDGAIDEQVQNACGECGPVPAEVCNGGDDDCDGEVDEGWLNACGGCGPVPPESCDARDNDCDGAIDEFLPENRCRTGCGPVPSEICNQHDDDCDGTLDEGLPRNACGVCGPLPEEVCDAEDNDCDGATDEGLPLNSCGECGPQPAETCNEADDDCDGFVDENFRVGRSTAHCEGCDRACDTTHATPACIGGRCVVVACDEGFRDADVDASNGCEAPAPESRVVYVDAAAEPGGDGLPETPYRQITEALAAALEADQIIVLPGTYAGPIAIETEGVVVQAQDSRTAIVGGMITVSADHSAAVGLVVDAPRSQWGIRLDCGLGCAAIDNEVRGLAPDRTPLTGIEIVGTVGARVRGNFVHDLVAPLRLVQGCTNSSPATFGLRAVGARDLVVSENRISDVRGSLGTQVPEACVTRGAYGGPAFGLYFHAVSGLRLVGNEVAAVQGAVAALRSGSGDGGAAVGIYIGASADVFVDGGGLDAGGERKAIQGLTGGVSLAGDPVGIGGAAIGLQVFQVDGLEVRDLLIRRLTGGGAVRNSETNLHVIGGPANGVRLWAASAARFSGVVLEDLRGGANLGVGGRGPHYGFWIDAGSSDLLIDQSNTLQGEPLFAALGIDGVEVRGLEARQDLNATNLGRIVVRGGRDALITGARISGFTGNPGVTGVHDASRLGQPGAEAVAIRVEGVSGTTTIDDTRVELIRGGRGGANQDLTSSPGGRAAGVLISDCAAVSLTESALQGIVGGPDSADQALQGAGAGLLIEGGNLVARNTLISGVEGSEAVGVSLTDVSLAEVLRATIVASHGVGLSIRGEVFSLRVADSIFALLGASIVNAVEEPERVQVDYCNFDRVAAPAEGALGDHNLSENTRFTNEILADYSLQAGSPCVDAGDPSGDCGAEPVGEGDTCAPDMGHLAGTGAAKARP